MGVPEKIISRVTNQKVNSLGPNDTHSFCHMSGQQIEVITSSWSKASVRMRYTLWHYL